MQESALCVREIRTDSDARVRKKSESEHSEESEKPRHAARKYLQQRRQNWKSSQNSYRTNQNQHSNYNRNSNMQTAYNNRSSYNNNINQQTSNQNNNNSPRNGSNEPQNKEKPAKAIICPNCNKEGHRRAECTEELVLKCYWCQKPGYTMKNCSKPSCVEKNKRRGK